MFGGGSASTPRNEARGHGCRNWPMQVELLPAARAGAADQRPQLAYSPSSGVRAAVVDTPVSENACAGMAGRQGGSVFSSHLSGSSPPSSSGTMEMPEDVLVHEQAASPAQTITKQEAHALTLTPTHSCLGPHPETPRPYRCRLPSRTKRGLFCRPSQPAAAATAATRRRRQCALPSSRGPRTRAGGWRHRGATREAAARWPGPAS